MTDREILELQIEAYGAELLQRDLSKFRSLLERLRAICNTSYVTSEVLHVPDQVHCMLKHYDQLFEQCVLCMQSSPCTDCRPFCLRQTSDHSRRGRMLHGFDHAIWFCKSLLAEAA
eukprot:TRINITY_DN10195_c0_g1_i3.p1 TRINITY_DN10195_c0_g1~~TRINITY_DN10195_c0_g1_i3.p1  ORF type:complete len:116 (+),score=3.75 TRINITY_DN10195_c0_g1_i3:397-744(+)